MSLFRGGMQSFTHDHCPSKNLRAAGLQPLDLMGSHARNRGLLWRLASTVTVLRRLVTRCLRRRYPRDAKQRACMAVRGIAPGSESSILKVTAIPVLLPLFPDEPSITTLVVWPPGPTKSSSIQPRRCTTSVAHRSRPEMVSARRLTTKPRDDNALWTQARQGAGSTSRARAAPQNPSRYQQ